MRHRLLMTIACALGLSQCSDEVSISPATLQRNFHLPSSALSIAGSRFNPDLNVLVVQLHTAPGSEFYAALITQGWQQQGSRYLRDNCYLEYDSTEACIIIKSTQYLPAGDYPQPLSNGGDRSLRR